MKVCEHDGLSCPACGSTKQPVNDGRDIVTTLEGVKLHRCICTDCGFTFYVECED